MQTTTRDYYRYKISIYKLIAGRRSFSVSQILKKKKIMNQNTFGTKIPFCEPYWYQGFHSPYYRESHISLRNKVRIFVENELIPNVDEWIEKG